MDTVFNTYHIKVKEIAGGNSSLVYYFVSCNSVSLREKNASDMSLLLRQSAKGSQHLTHRQSDNGEWFGTIHHVHTFQLELKCFIIEKQLK